MSANSDSSPEPILAPPRGMRDFYPEDMSIRNTVFDAWRNSARRFGFQEYDACVVESLDLLRRKAGEEIVNQIYAFTDKSGRELALRPEMTPTLARMIAARQGSLMLPVKWFTIAQCFRYERMTRGRKREHYQWNLDIVGENSVSAEAEVIATALSALESLGLGRDSLRVHFSNRALLSDLLLKLGIPTEHHTATFLALDKRGKVPDDEIRTLLTTEGLNSTHADAVFELLKISTFEDALSLLGASPPSCENILQFRQELEAYGVNDRVVFDISVIRGLAYYTGIVFEAYDINRSLRALFGGGRYDNLLATVGGKPASGVGLGCGDVTVTELLLSHPPATQTQRTRTAIGYMEPGQRLFAMRAATALRKSGHEVDLGLHAEKAKHFFSRSGKGDFSHGIYIGPDDVAQSSVRIKNMSDRSECVKPISEL
jgi:histidyl-tRNA synthetase